MLQKELKGLSCESPEEESVSPSPMDSDTHEDIPEKKEVPVPPSHLQRAPGSITALLEERLELYKDAINAAKELNDSSKVRRYSRAVKVSISN